MGVNPYALKRRSTPPNPDGFEGVRYCERCGVIWAPGNHGAHLCKACAHEADKERKRWEAVQAARAKDGRFAASGKSAHNLVMIPGGLDGWADGWFWENELVDLAAAQPELIGMICIKDDREYWIREGGRLEKRNA